MSELRDVVDHIKNACSTDDGEQAKNELVEAYEHLRRAAVESLQRASTKVYFETLNTIRTPLFLHRLVGVEVPDKGEVRTLRIRARTNIEEGRNLKSDKSRWTDSLQLFKNAIDDCLRIQDMYPSSGEVWYRFFMIIFGIVTILSFIYGIMK
jgi:hypothetical protein